VLATLLAIRFVFASPICAQFTPAVPYGPGAPSAAPTNATISQIEVEAISWLQGFMRINTTNPPGNELVAAKYLADILQKNGIQSEIFESTPGRGIIVARLSATAVADPARALLLMGHLDVVGVNKAKWTVDPFAAVLKDGYIYGRGAIDDKSMTIANLAVFIAIKRSGVRLTRDLIFLSEGDEEAGGESGMKFAVEKHWDKIAAGYALNEGGPIRGGCSQRKSADERGHNRNGTLRPCVFTHQGQRRGSSVSGHRQDWDVRNPGSVQHRFARLF
jgi:acetylornithine deacetylase/succinyl-diaminopimelate desuccinylase-like protein